MNITKCANLLLLHCLKLLPRYIDKYIRYAIYNCNAFLSNLLAPSFPLFLYFTY